MVGRLRGDVTGRAASDHPPADAQALQPAAGEHTHHEVCADWMLAASLALDLVPSFYPS